MKNLIFILLFSLIGKTSMAAPPKIELVYNERIAVFMFIAQISPSISISQFKTIFEASKYNTETNQIKLGSFDALSILFNDITATSFNEEDYPKLTIRIEAQNKIFDKLIQSNSINEFREKSVNIISDQELSILVDALETFTPIYNELIYSPNEIVFTEQLTNLQNSVKEKNIPSYLEKVSTFLQTPLEDVRTFKVALIPSLDSNYSHIDRNPSHLIHPLFLKENRSVDIVTLILTYLSNDLIDRHQIEFGVQMYLNFQKNPSPHSFYAHPFFYGAITSVLANGYNYEQLQSDLYQLDGLKSFYTNEIAKAIFPKVLEYLEQNKQLDKDFCDSYIDIYQNFFGESTNDLNFIMLNRALVAPDDSYSKQLYEIYPETFYEHSTLFDNIYLAADFLKSEERTKVLIIYKDHKYNLKSAKKLFPELADWEYDPTQEFVKIQFLKDRTNLVIINQHDTPLKELLEGYSNK